ncbi:hypothetical protein CSC18_4785 [Klebsiella aerogenes]|nr:hypothetical protein CSC18_4785 [Klebsiella aerogenes]
MVYIQKTEIQRTPLCGFFSWFQGPAAAKMTAVSDQIALRENWLPCRGVMRQILRSVTRTMGTR